MNAARHEDNSTHCLLEDETEKYGGRYPMFGEQRWFLYIASKITGFELDGWGSVTGRDFSVGCYVQILGFTHNRVLRNFLRDRPEP
jgi:hypothetical protein